MGSLTFLPGVTGGGVHAGLLTTGIVTGLVVSGAVGGTTFSVAPGVYFVQDESDPNAIIQTKSVYPGADDIPISNVTTEDFTYLFLDPSGVLIQRPEPPQFADIDADLVYLGNLTHDRGSGVLEAAPTNLGWMAYGGTPEQVKVSFLQQTTIERGARVDFGVSSTQPAVTAGTFNRMGANRAASTQNPDRLTVAGTTYGDNSDPATNVTVRAFSDGAGGVTIEPAATIDPANYDDGSGVLAAGLPPRYYRHYLFGFPRSNGGIVVVHQFDTTPYLLQGDALSAERPTPFGFLDEAALLAELVVIGSATDIAGDLATGAAVLNEPHTVAALYKGDVVE